ncbi:hypothetical protein GCM10022240_05600 [Microbacterium kribbense]|uniref:Carbohydrate kinase PfkB domain-containing protein n=1 Tax=Microbacterium kribbense TaxID=433645 RepID=A0ABP7G3S0_9MICO
MRTRAQADDDGHDRRADAPAPRVIHTGQAPGFPQTPIDTNGAGDTHTGALLAGIAAGATWAAACRRADAAAIKVTRRGPTTAPTAAEVDDFLRGR